MARAGMGGGGEASDFFRGRPGPVVFLTAATTAAVARSDAPADAEGVSAGLSGVRLSGDNPPSAWAAYRPNAKVEKKVKNKVKDPYRLKLPKKFSADRGRVGQLSRLVDYAEGRRPFPEEAEWLLKETGTEKQLTPWYDVHFYDLWRNKAAVDDIVDRLSMPEARLNIADAAAHVNDIRVIRARFKEKNIHPLDFDSYTKQAQLAVTARYTEEIVRWMYARAVLETRVLGPGLRSSQGSFAHPAVSRLLDILANQGNPGGIVPVVGWLLYAQLDALDSAKKAAAKPGRGSVGAGNPSRGPALPAATTPAVGSPKSADSVKPRTDTPVTRLMRGLDARLLRPAKDAHPPDTCTCAATARTLLLFMLLGWESPRLRSEVLAWADKNWPPKMLLAPGSPEPVAVFRLLTPLAVENGAESWRLLHFLESSAENSTTAKTLREAVRPIWESADNFPGAKDFEAHSLIARDTAREVALTASGARIDNCEKPAEIHPTAAEMVPPPATTTAPDSATKLNAASAKTSAAAEVAASPPASVAATAATLDAAQARASAAEGLAQADASAAAEALAAAVPAARSAADAPTKAEKAVFARMFRSFASLVAGSKARRGAGTAAEPRSSAALDAALRTMYTWELPELERLYMYSLKAWPQRSEMETLFISLVHGCLRQRKMLRADSFFRVVQREEMALRRYKKLLRLPRSQTALLQGIAVALAATLVAKVVTVSAPLRARVAAAVEDVKRVFRMQMWKFRRLAGDVARAGRNVVARLRREPIEGKWDTPAGGYWEPPVSEHERLSVMFSTDYWADEDSPFEGEDHPWLDAAANSGSDPEAHWEDAGGWEGPKKRRRGKKKKRKKKKKVEGEKPPEVPKPDICEVYRQQYLARMEALRLAAEEEDSDSECDYFPPLPGAEAAAESDYELALRGQGPWGRPQWLQAPYPGGGDPGGYFAPSSQYESATQRMLETEYRDWMSRLPPPVPNVPSPEQKPQQQATEVQRPTSWINNSSPPLKELTGQPFTDFRSANDRSPPSSAVGGAADFPAQLKCHHVN